MWEVLWRPRRWFCWRSRTLVWRQTVGMKGITRGGIMHFLSLMNSMLVPAAAYNACLSLEKRKTMSFHQYCRIWDVSTHFHPSILWYATHVTQPNSYKIQKRIHICVFSAKKTVKWFNRNKQLGKGPVQKTVESVYESFGNPRRFACFTFFLFLRIPTVYYSTLDGVLQSKSWSLASLTPLSHKGLEPCHPNVFM